MKRSQLILLIVLVTSGIGFSQNFENTKHILSSGGGFSNSGNFSHFAVFGETLVNSGMSGITYSGNAGFLVSDTCVITSVSNMLQLESLFSFYPNPCNNFIYFQASENCFANKINLINLEGSEIYSLYLAEKYEKIDLYGLSQGVYCVVVYDKENRILGRTKIVKY